LTIGEIDFPFAIPLVKDRDEWRFDVDAGRRELLYRRIGRNEYGAIQSVLAYVDAQNEYADSGAAGKTGVYAQRFASSPGKKDGLYWPTQGNEPPSPLGDLVAEATADGYKLGGARRPFYGYYFKILTKQGRNAPGGAVDYVVKGEMIGGFALVAYPAEYGNSGVMTFVVNHAGTVYQKDLGPNTTRLAERITVFDPDQTWKEVELAVLTDAM
jgi:hypothetical protein